MENKIGEIVTLLPYDTKARVVEVQSDSCEGATTRTNYISVRNTDAIEYLESVV